MRPSTDGCTEFSCPYHGTENRFKATHAEGCAVRDFPYAIMDAVQAPACTCGKEDR